MSTNIGIPENDLKEVALELNKLLADEFVLYTKTRNYHWNVECPNFLEMHNFYEGQYKQIDILIDKIAERIRTIGHYALGRLKDYLEVTYLLEQENTNNYKEQLNNLLNDHEAIIRNLRNLIPLFADKYKDQGSSDFATSVLKSQEKNAWIIRSFLKE